MIIVHYGSSLFSNKNYMFYYKIFLTISLTVRNLFHINFITKNCKGHKQFLINVNTIIPILSQ